MDVSTSSSLHSLRPTLVPRRRHDNGRLEFYIVFGLALQNGGDFPRDEFFGLKEGQPKANWPEKVLRWLNGNAVDHRPAPQVILTSTNLPQAKKYPIKVIDYPEKAKENAKVRALYFENESTCLRGLSIDPKDQGDSEKAWLTFFHACARDAFIAKVGVAGTLATPSSLPIPAAPSAGSTLAAAITSPVASIVGSPAVITAPAALAPAVPPPPAIVLPQTPKLGTDSVANPRTASELRPINRLESPDLDAYHDALAANSVPNRKSATASEFRRTERMIKSGRNRHGGDTKEKFVKGSTKTDTSSNPLYTPTWQDLFGRAAQYPGLQRRLKLAIYCAIDTGDDLKDFDQGTITLDISADDPSFLGLHIDVLTTAYITGREEGHDKDGEDQRRNYFRAMPATTVEMPTGANELTNKGSLVTNLLPPRLCRSHPTGHSTFCRARNRRCSVLKGAATVA